MTYTPIKKTLRRYQQLGFKFLFRHLTNGHREVVLSGPTGCGKTLMVTYSVERLLQTDKYVSACIVAPQKQIQAGFLHKEDMLVVAYPEEDPGFLSVLGDVLVKHAGWTTPHGRCKDQFTNHIRARKPSTRVLVSTHQAVSMWFDQDENLLDLDLTGRILVIDEAHHASGINQIGTFAKEWKARGGTVLHLTATPFRTDDDILMDPDAPRWTLTLADHILSGFAPNTVRIRSHPIPMVARSAEELGGTKLGQTDFTTSCKSIVDLWDADFRPSAGVIVPIKDAEGWADALQKAFEAAGARVFNAVKGGPAKSKELEAVLAHERKAADPETGHYSQSRYDVILACARLNEGTDWPFCSHVYNIGLTYSFLLILQRLGRGLRPKSEIPGYPARHRNQTMFTFLVPSSSEEVFEAFEQKHKDHAFMTACFMADVDTGMSFLNTVSRKMDSARPRTGKYRPSAETWEDVIQAINADVSECRTAVRHMVLAINALQQEGVRKPTDGQVIEFLKVKGKLKSPDIDKVTRTLQYNRMQRKSKAFQGFMSRLLRKIRHIEDYVGDPRIIREDLQAIFDEMLAEFADEVADVDLTTRALNHMSKFTGRSSNAVSVYLRRRYGQPRPTDEEIRRAALTFRAAGGVLPPPLQEDASEHFGYAPGLLTWGDLNRQLAEREREVAA